VNPQSLTAQAANSQNKTVPPPACEAVIDNTAITIKSDEDAKQQACVCVNPVTDKNKTRTFQSLKYTVQAKLFQGSPVVETRVSKTNIKAEQNTQCIVEYCPPGVKSGSSSCKVADSLNRDTLGGVLMSRVNSAVPDYPRQIAQQITAGEIKSSDLSGKISNATQKSVLDAFSEIKQSEEATKSLVGSGTYTDEQLSDTERQLNNIATCGTVEDCAKQQGDIPATDPSLNLNPEVKDSQGSLSKDEFTKAFCASNPQDPSCPCAVPLTPCKTSSCADTQQKVYGPGDSFNRGPGNAPTQEKTSSIGGFGGILQSVFGSLARALGGALGGALSGSGNNCTADQNQYQQQQQQYQQQMTLYNQQLQQYNYQVQMAQMQGYPPPPQPTPPTQPCFNQSNSAVQCSTSPAQPAASGCQGGTWKPTTQSGNSCISGWQCVPGSGAGTGAPVAQLSCQPQVADVGMTIAISFSCGNATGSAGQGFDTGNALSGSATTTIDNPPAGATKATYGLRCVNASVPATASCSVDISRPSIILVANPKVVPVNASSTIGWLTTGMESCVVSSPDMQEFNAQNALNTSVNGMAITPPLTETAQFLLHCTTLGGQTKDATTTVQVGAPDNGSGGGVQVSASAEGHAINRGETMSISWQSGTTTTGNAEMDLWLYDVALDAPTALIKGYLNPTGSFNWKLPLAGDACDANASAVCGTDLIPGREYAIEAVLYPSDDPDAQYMDYGFTADTFTVGG
jgi:hypothetical protein